MLVLVDLDSLADSARFDKLFSLHAWPSISVSGHLDGLLLASMGAIVQCLVRCLPKRWWQKEDSAGGDLGRFSFISPPLFSGQEKSGVDATLSVAASI